MSLSSFIKDHEVKRFFADSFDKPKSKIRGEIKAPPLTTKYSLVGTAFDYLLRFHLGYHYPNAITRKWVAEEACELMKIHEPNEVYKIAKNQVDIARNLHGRFLDNGVLTDDLIRSTMVLAHLDIYIRAGRNAFYKSIQIEPNDIQDLKNLINLVDFDIFKAKNHCILNPTFNEGSYLVGGADADIVIDNKLIDVKTTKELTITRDMFNQVVGYYLLGRIGGIGNELVDGSTIDKIGFYFSRYGILHLYDVNEIFDFKTLPKIMNKLDIMAKERFESLSLATLPEVKKLDSVVEERIEPLPKSTKKWSIFARISEKLRMMYLKYQR